MRIFRIAKSNDTDEDVIIKVVSGKTTRQETEVDFMGGGHHWVYDFIPRNEIWVEELKENNEKKYIAIHELIERLLMKHKHKSYLSAHDIANEYEQMNRHGKTYQQVFKDFIEKHFNSEEEK